MHKNRSSRIGAYRDPHAVSAFIHAIIQALLHRHRATKQPSIKHSSSCIKRAHSPTPKKIYTYLSKYGQQNEKYIFAKRKVQ